MRQDLCRGIDNWPWNRDEGRLNTKITYEESAAEKTLARCRYADSSRFGVTQEMTTWA
jgi:hypothetical protein